MKDSYTHLEVQIYHTYESTNIPRIWGYKYTTHMRVQIYHAYEREYTYFPSRAYNTSYVWSGILPL